MVISISKALLRDMEKLVLGSEGASSTPPVDEDPAAAPHSVQIVKETAAIHPLLAASLRPHQLAGVRWLIGAFHGAHRPGCRGGILRDGMGLGKTVQVGAPLCPHPWHSAALLRR